MDPMPKADQSGSQVSNRWISARRHGHRGAIADVDVDGLVNHHQAKVEGQPTSRADMTAGALYAITGEADWIYYGQVTPEKKVGFFRQRDRDLADPATVLEAPIMSVVTVAYRSITRAIRAGRWKKLGRFSTAEALITPRPSVQGQSEALP
jgi:hypothetical protein